MRHFHAWALMAPSVALASAAFAQQDSGMKIAKLTDHLYKLTAERGSYVVNIVASVGNDGLLLVDTGERETAEELKTAVKSMGKGIPRIIINTHAHVDHTGANGVFGTEPVIIGHDILRTRLRSGSYLFDDYPDESLPDITFTDAASVYFNGEEIRIIACGGSHDDNDAIVWFTASRIVCIGDIANGLFFPSVEEVTGNVLNFPRVVQRVIDLVPDDVTFISGHGVDCNKDGLRSFKQMVEATAEIVRAGLDQGKSCDTLIEEDVLRGWESWAESYVSKESWITSLCDAITGGPHKKTLYEPIYRVLQEKGADAAVDEYYRLKRENLNDYRFTENDLAFMADKLFRHGRFPEAVKFLGLCIDEYPKGVYAYYCHYLTAKAYRSLGDNERAIVSLRRALELKPDFPRARQMLDELQIP